MKASPKYGELDHRWHRHAHTRHNLSGNVEDNPIRLNLEIDLVILSERQ
jgi:hypothetical protein